MQTPSVTLIANPIEIYQNGSSIISWSSIHTNYCTASGAWSGTKGTSGSETVSPPQTSTYSITCTGQNGSAVDSEIVTVRTSLQGNGIIIKTARNITLNQTGFSGFIEAQGNDTVEFEIRVQNTTSGMATIVVRDTLPSALYYIVQSTKVNGVGTTDGIATVNGLVLPNIASNEEKIITFRAGVFANPTQGLIVNEASATVNNAATHTSSANIQIRSRATVLGAASVVTGPPYYWPWLAAVSFIAAMGLYFGLFRVRFAGVASLGSALSDMRLQWYAWRIRRRENL